MPIKTSLRLLAIATAFLGAEATLAQSSFSTAQDLVANNTLTNQSSGVYNLPNPDSIDFHATQIDREIGTDSSNNPNASDATIRSTAIDRQFGTDLAHQPQPAASGKLASIKGIRSTVFTSNIATPQANYQISGVPTDPTAEASIVIPVPPPLTWDIKPRQSSYAPRGINPISVPTAASPQATTPVPAPKPNAFNQGVQSNQEFIYPLMTLARVSSGYGWRAHPLTGRRRFHSGIDISAPTGTPVVAVGSGTVISAGWRSGYGKTITIQHNETQQTLYGHLSEISVQAGQTIAQGTVIGLVGSTGNSTGPHLHYEIRMPNGDRWTAVNPTEDIKYAADNLRRSSPYARKEIPPTGF
jgi:murein DD-endopeptidase MepM/ murein hydrolase activator NlpD